MGHLTLSEMMRMSIAMPVLFGLSLLVLAFAMERFYVYWISESLPTGLWARVKGKLEDNDRDGALSLCLNSPGLVSQALAKLLSLPKADTETLVENFQLYRQKMQMDLSKRVGLFGTASFIAPLIGLMGTVLGIMRAFHDLSVAGAGGPAVVAAGISEALVATAAGIGVAVVSAVLYNYFTISSRQRLGTLDLWVLELSHLLAEEPRG